LWPKTTLKGLPLLDLSSALDQAADESSSTDINMFSGSVLVAEDVEFNQKLMTFLLKEMGLEVSIAEDGHQVLKKALSQSFDLILMDMQMPHMSGYEAACALKQQGYQTPIVALTANAMKDDHQKCIDAGCKDYLTKPIDRGDLSRMLAKYLPRRQEETSKATDSARTPSHELGQPGSRQFPGPVPSSEQNKTSEIINWDQLVATLGGEKTVREIMPDYIEDTKTHFEKLSQAVEMGDCQSIATHAQALTGVGRNLGNERLSDIARQMDCSGTENDIETSTLLFNDLKTEFEKVLTVLDQCDWIEKTKSA